MGKKTLADLLVQLTIDKAKKEDKHPMEIMGELKALIADKRRMERQRVIQAVLEMLCMN
ncbi:MAG: hypothetical protein LWX70_10755 [Sphingobacteriia bacterium]|nr:hypothetical protein [Sphingobacteriia bacterium]